MDEKEYKEVYHSVNELRCVFEKAILTRRFACEHLHKINIAEREAASCQNPPAQQQCEQLLSLLRKNAAFALKLTHVHGPLPHAKEIKVQCGGLIGLHKLVGTGSSDPAEPISIHACVEQAVTEFNSLETLPYPEIIQSITQFEGRRKRKK